MLAALQSLIKTHGNLFNFRDAPLQFKLENNQTFSNMSSWTSVQPTFCRVLLNIKIQKETEIYRAPYPKIPPTHDAGKLSVNKNH